MSGITLVALLISAAALPDTGSVRQTVPLREPDRFEQAIMAAVDTPTTPLVEYSDAYATRLAIHRIASWTMLPLFAAQYYTGSKLFSQGASAPAWVRTSVMGPSMSTSCARVISRM